MIRISRAWIAHHALQYGINWSKVSARYYAELEQSKGKNERR